MLEWYFVVLGLSVPMRSPQDLVSKTQTVRSRMCPVPMENIAYQCTDAPKGQVDLAKVDHGYGELPFILRRDGFLEMLEPVSCVARGKIIFRDAAGRASPELERR